MVDALSRASRWVAPQDGCVIDLRPANIFPVVEIGTPEGAVVRIGGLIVDDERRRRHASADAAIRTVLERGILRLDREQIFIFYRYAGSGDELRDYIATKWQHTRMGSSTVDAAAEALRQHPGGRLWLREDVYLGRLLPPELHA